MFTLSKKIIIYNKTGKKLEIRPKKEVKNRKAGPA